MNEYPINIENGKVTGDSTFYTTVYDMLGNECKRLRDFTDSLDKEPNIKKGKIAEYKCAKYRYAAVSLIHSVIYNNHKFRKERNLEASHYLLPSFDDLLKKQTEYMSQYDSAQINEKPDHSLYFITLTIIQSELDEINANLQAANDFEKIELQERIDGLKFAKDCLDTAWQRRKEVLL